MDVRAMFSLHGLTGQDRRDVRNAQAREKYRTPAGRAAAERSARRWYAHRGGREASRVAQRRRLYGLTQEAFEALRVSQGGRCAFDGCTSEPTDVDHDHVTGAVRGLLCRRCNVALGFVEKFGQAATAYLSRSAG